jgi:hypothetical protein
LRLAWTKAQDPKKQTTSKMGTGAAQVVEGLCSKLKVLSFVLRTAKRMNKQRHFMTCENDQIQVSMSINKV